MPTRKTPQPDTLHDFTVNARAVVEETIGRKLPPLQTGFAPSNERDAVIGAILRRNNIRSTVRSTGVPQNRVKVIVVAAGDACARLHQALVQDVECGALQCGARKVLQEKSRGAMRDRARLLSVGSAWAWTSIDLESRFVPRWRVAPCNVTSAKALLRESPCRPNRVRLAVNGRELVEWSSEADYSIDQALESAFGAEPDEGVHAEMDNPSDVATDPWPSMLSEGFVRKIQRHSAVLALLFTYHNFAALDPVTKLTPAMAARVANHVWSPKEMIDLLSGY